MSDDIEMSVKSAKDIAGRLRCENHEQFVTLVRMHLSFELDLTTDDCETLSCDKIKGKKWNKFHKKAKGCTSGKSNSPPELNKQPLTEEGIRQVRQLIDFLAQDQNIIQEGIFRRTGALSRQTELKNLMNLGRDLNLNAGGYTVHDCASVLKGFLADLPEPLLTDAYYTAHCQIADIYNSADSVICSTKEVRLLHSLQLLILLLPNDNRTLLENIIEILHRTIQYEKNNKMSADSLATLFTPHLICPRKLTPEALHSTAQNMSGVISFMISKGLTLFETPPKLATDIRAYFLEQKRKKTMSPEQILDESFASDSTANTVYTFVDREKTAEAHNTNPTDTALAQLYAHIQSLPESSKKRKLIKQFNKENGQGTPLQILMVSRMKNSTSIKSGKSLGDSIKKHILHKSLVSKTTKRSNTSTPSSFDQTPNGGKRFIGGYSANPKTRVLFQSPMYNTSTLSKYNIYNNASPSIRKSQVSLAHNDSLKSTVNSPNLTCTRSFNKISDKLSPQASHIHETQNNTNLLENDCLVLTNNEKIDDEFDKNTEEQISDDYDDEIMYSTPPPINDLKNNNSSISRYKSEPNLSTFICDDNSIVNVSQYNNNNRRNNCGTSASMNNLSTIGLDNNNRAIKSLTMIGKKFHHKHSDDINDNNSKLFNSPILFTNKVQNLLDNKLLTPNKDDWNLDYITSTPALFIGRNSMSPITKSTQRMPKSMQESIMTPRSRKPVMLLGVTMVGDQGRSNSFTSFREEDEELLLGNQENDDEENGQGKSSPPSACYTSNFKGNTSNVNKNDCSQILNLSHSTSAPDSLTSTFKDYLFSRSVLTASPVDSSFSSHPDDFGSTTDVRDLNESDLSESLLFCLDGNKPNGLSTTNDDYAFDDENINNLSTSTYQRKRQMNSQNSNCRDDGGSGDNKENINDNDEDDVKIKKLVLHHNVGGGLGETTL